MAFLKQHYTVLYILGWCRSGSTIIGNILNEIDGFFHLGELHFLWKNYLGLGTNSKCGCGELLADCEVWSKVIQNISEEADSQAMARKMVSVQQKLRTRQTLKLLYSPMLSKTASDYVNLFKRVYKQIHHLTNSHVIIDGGKFPFEAALLSKNKNLNVKYLHIVRDPRAVAFSWSKRKDYIYRLSAMQSTGYWIGFNLCSHAVCKSNKENSLFIKYEDFITSPKYVIDQILDLVQEGTAKNPLLDNKIMMTQNHTVTGNPDRFIQGEVTIRSSDNSWQKDLSGYEKKISTCLGWPLMKLYNY